MERSSLSGIFLRTNIRVVVALFFTAAPASAQLTPEQKRHDFQNLAAIYTKRYAPYEWKKELLGFDLLEIGPWLDRVSESVDDLEFFEIALDYVASLEDTHSSFRVPSSFRADLGFGVDIYDDKVLIESINRAQLPEDRYPFQIGDELVSMDGRTSEDWMTEFSRFLKRGNPRSTRRTAADFLTFRQQARVPRVIDLPDAALVEIRRQNGDLESYTVPWVKLGVPLRWIGPVPGPAGPKQPTGLAETAGLPSYFEPWLELTNFRLPDGDPLLAGETVSEEAGTVPRRYVLGLGQRSPVFQGGLPRGFVQRLGLVPTDFHFSGVYESAGLKIGYLRLPNFAPFNQASAIQELREEVAFFEGNTDGLVVDVMRNTGGGCYMFTAASYLIPDPFYFFGEEVRVTIDRINSLQAALEAARRAGAEQWIIDLYTEYLRQLEAAYRENRGLTDPIPACSLLLHDNEPAKDADGNVIAYTKPLIVLIDDFSLSAGDIFPAMLQDNQRGPLVGTRTNGAGGSVSGWPAGIYSESSTSNTNTLVTRIAPVEIPGYPISHYIENIGAHADVQLEYMTRENLLTRGRPFVEAFTRIMVEHIRAQR